MKKLITMILTMAIAVSTMVVPTMAGTDQPSSWAQEYVEVAREREYLPEWLDNNYQAPITREEFAELFVTTILKAHSDSIPFTKYDERYFPFTTIDVDRFNERVTTDFRFTDTDNKYVLAAWKMGAVDGIGNGKFGGEGTLTREQGATMIVRGMQVSPIFKRGANVLFSDADISDMNKVSDWAKPHMLRAYNVGLVSGTTKAIYDYNITTGENTYSQKATLDPKGVFTREQAIVILTRIMIENFDDATNRISLRGYTSATLPQLYADFEISKDGNTIYVKDSGFHWENDRGYQYTMSKSDKHKEVVGQYTSLQNTLNYVGLPSYQMNGLIEYIEPYMSKHILVDVGPHTTEKNTGEYLAIIRRKPEWNGITSYQNYTDNEGNFVPWNYEYTILD